MSKIISNLASVGIISLSSLVLGLLLNKAIATLHGPSGLASFSIIKQIIVTFSFFAVGVQAVVVQGIACRDGDARKFFFVQTFLVHLLIAVVSAFLFWVVFVLFARSLPSAASVVLGVPVALIAFSIFFAGIYYFGKSALNGFRAVNDLLFVEITGPVVMIIVLLLGRYFGYLVVPILFSFAFLFSYGAMSLLAVFRAFYRVGVFHSSLPRVFSVLRLDVSSFLAASAFSTGAALIGTICLLFVKLGIVENFDLEVAGYFDAAWSISSAYLAVLVGSFGMYYLPALSSDTRIEWRVEIVRKIFRLAAIFSSVLICVFVSVKTAIINVLYTADFSPAISLLGWMFVGDFFKVCAWVLALVSVSKGDFKTFFVTEFCFWVAFSGGALALGHLSVGLEWVGVLYCALYVFLFLFYVFEVWIVNSIALTTREWAPWLLGLFFICVCFSLTLGDLRINWLSTALGGIVLPVFHFVILNKAEKNSFVNVFLKRWRG